MLRATLISRRLQYDPAIPPPSSRPGCLGPAWRRKRPDGWTSTTQGKPESDCQNNAPKSAREWRHATTPRLVPTLRHRTYNCRLRRRTFSQTRTLNQQCAVLFLRSSGAHTYLACNRSLPCKRSATGNKSQDRTAPFGSQTPCSTKESRCVD